VRVPDPRLSQAQEVAQALTARPASVEHALGGGRNSRIFRVRCDAGEFALKQYPPHADDPRDRVAAEIRALQLMERNGIDNVPRVIGVDPTRGFALLSWIDSSAVTTIADSDIDAAAGFLAQIHALRNTPLAKEQPLAAEACLSGIEIERQITKRLARLLRIPGEHDLLVFLDKTFAPAFERERIQAKSKMQAAGLDFTAELPQEWRSLVASDFGFHNSLRRRDGSLAFIDFEYFGWDDPVKLTADFLLHPGTTLTAPQRLRFRQLAERLYGDDRGFAARLDAYLALFGLRWVLILLNEFIPDRWQRRVLAGASEGWAEAKATQLAHAVDFLAALREKVEG
jgi:phosphotransferase family enzyme